jgi:hypothetical protein
MLSLAVLLVLTGSSVSELAEPRPVREMPDMTVVVLGFTAENDEKVASGPAVGAAPGAMTEPPPPPPPQAARVARRTVQNAKRKDLDMLDSLL